MKLILEKKTQGQALSRLSVIYVVAICISLSWHELWTSGIKVGNLTLIEDDQYPDYPEDVLFLRESDLKQMRGLAAPNTLKCTKNVLQSPLISLVHIVYFVVLFAIYSALFILSKLVWLRLKNVTLCGDFFDSDLSIDENIDFIDRGKTSTPYVTFLLNSNTK